ncbi:MAG: hypothetical protein JJU31_14465 [Wenzhouxiangella sp.]|nr:hypothetical protein [Wenzhouxiangella sp.]
MDGFAAGAPRMSHSGSAYVLARMVFLGLVGLAFVWALIHADFSIVPGSGIWFRYELWVFLLAWTLLPFGLGLLWRWNLLFSVGWRLPWTDWLATQSVAWAGRYLPGKAGLWIAKIGAFGFKEGTKRRVSHSVIVEQVLFLLSGLLFALLLLPWARLLSLTQFSDAVPAAVLTHAGSALGLGMRVLVALTLVCSTLLFLSYLGTKLGAGMRRTDAFRWLGLLTAHASIHLALGLSLYPLISLMLPDAALMLGPLGVAAVLALANSLGIMAVFAPAGLGVREAVLALCLSVDVAFAAALSVALFLRLVTMLADGLFSVLGGAAALVMRRLCQAPVSRH